MEFIFGVCLLLAGGALSLLGIKMFIKSEGWFLLFKALIVIMVGFTMFATSFELF